MAKIIPKLNIPNWGEGDQLTSNIISKSFRLKILLYDRLLRGFAQADVDGPRGSYETEPGLRRGEKIKKHRYDVTNGEPQTSSGVVLPTNSQRSDRKPTSNYFESNPEHKDYISIIDYDYKPTSEKTSTTEASNDSKPKLSNRRYKELRIPFVPRELQVNPESNFVGISSFGRNNPFYQFTGAEDTLTFEIDWLSSENSREDVITFCRWIEALTKGDSYNDVPHRIILMWGADNKLFKDYKWLIVAAPYRLMNFNRGYMENDKFINTSMLPSRAIQSITLKRITEENLTSANIIGNLNL